MKWVHRHFRASDLMTALGRQVCLAAAALLLFPAAAAPARAALRSLREFEGIPLLENGRVMPLDTFARSSLLALNGRSTFERASASHWLARVLLTPESTRDDKVFLVNNPEVGEALGLPAAKGRKRYSYRELEPVLGQLRSLVSSAWKLDKNDRSPVEQELLRLYQGVMRYIALTEALAFTLPHPDLRVTDPALKADLGLPAEADTFSILRIQATRPRLQPLWDRGDALAEEHGALYHQEVRLLAELLAELSLGRRDVLPKVMLIADQGQDVWLTPWRAISLGVDDGPLHEQLLALNDMAEAFRADRQVAFDIAARTFRTSVEGATVNGEALRRLGLEVRYNRSQAFYRAELLYGFGLLLVLVSLLGRARWLYQGGIVLTALALVPHTLGIVARMFIMGRPPVTNLYSTFVFVGWCCAILGLAIELLQRNRLGVLIASVSGLALLLTSGRFAVEGDTMGVMVAVLDSNFWLATHVVCITVGYAGCCVAGLIGHIYLLQALRRSPDHPALEETYRALFGALAFGLIFSFLGTMLGGVWADQSWGRFWGWDPKENGALIIVLWSALIFHARLGRMIGPAGFAAGCVLGVIWVLLAWLGVNLLGVGLHSYGFTSGIARGLLVACSVEVVFVAATLPFARKPRAPGLAAA